MNHTINKILDANKGESINLYKLSVLPLPLVIAVMTVTLVVGCVGNGIVVFIVVSKRRMQSYTNWMVTNLAVSDLAVMLFCIPFDIPLLVNQRWIYGRIVCTVYYPIGTMALLSSVFTIFTLNCTRSWGISHPFAQQANVSVARVVIAVIWLFSLILVVPIIVVLRHNSEYQVCYESWSHSARLYYTVAIFLFGYALPLSVCVVSYVIILYEVTLKAKRNNRHRDQRAVKENKSLMKLSMAVTMTFAVCVLPNQLVFLLYEFADLEEYKYNMDLRTGSHLMLFLNSAINPIIYNIFSENFRDAFQELIGDVVFRVFRVRSEMFSSPITIPSLSDDAQQRRPYGDDIIREPIEVVEMDTFLQDSSDA